jgi:thiaminase
MLRINLRVNKSVIHLFILVHGLLVPLYMLSDPDISIQISFDSFPNSLQQQQSIYGFAASERYLHNQSLQQAEPNLHAFSAEQLAQFFACRGYTEHQILSKRTLYMNPAFVALVRQYEGYEEAVTNLHKELQQTSGFYKWLGTLNGYHRKGLTKQIATLYHQLEQEKQVRVCTNAINDWSELCNIYKEYGCGENTHIQRRCDVLEDMQARGAISFDQAYILPRNVVQALRSHGHDPVVYVKAYGNQFQQVLHQECIELLTRTVDLPVRSVAYNHQGALVDCIDAAREYNQAGLVHKASVVTDFCRALLDYGSAVAEGVACGLIGAVQDMVEHPVQTVACIVAGEYVLAYQLCKVVCNVADIGVAALVNPSRAKKKWDDYIAPVSGVISAIKDKEITCRDAIKMGTGLAVGFVAQYKLLGGLSKFYGGIKSRAIAFAQNFPELTLQQYMQTPDGSLFKVSCKMDSKNGKNGKSAVGSGGPNTVKNAINEIKDELERARTWGEYFRSKVGQKFKNSFESLQKQNPHDGTPLYEFIDKKNETEMFKVGRVFAPDRGRIAILVESILKYGIKRGIGLVLPI